MSDAKAIATPEDLRAAARLHDGLHLSLVGDPVQLKAIGEARAARLNALADVMERIEHETPMICPRCQTPQEGVHTCKPAAVDYVKACRMASDALAFLGASPTSEALRSLAGHLTTLRSAFAQHFPAAEWARSNLKNDWPDLFAAIAALTGGGATL